MVTAQEFMTGHDKTRKKSPWKQLELFTDTENVDSKLSNVKYIETFKKWRLAIWIFALSKQD